MFSLKVNKERLLTMAVIVISVAGILYFGYKAIRDNSTQTQGNPFEYDIEEFKKTDAALVHYKETGRISVELQTVSGVSVGPDDRVYVSGDDSILIFNKEGTLHSKISMADPVYCLSVDKNHDLYLGMEDHVEIYNRTGEKKSSWESLGEEAIITSIALSKDYVFVADAGNLTVWKFNKSGNRLKRIGEKDEVKDIPGFIIPSPFFDVAMDPDGFLWVANTGRHSLENYTQDGGFRTSWGEFSMEIEGFCGCCNPSHFTILEDGSFVTSEKGIARVKVYNRIGELVSVVAPPDQFIEGTVGLDLAVDSSQRIYVLDPWQKLVRIFEKKTTLNRESIMMQDFQKIKNRREFLRDGLRAVVFGSLAFTGLFLGWRGYSRTGEESSCLVDLPCRSCSKLSNCQEPRAIDTNQKSHDSQLQSLEMIRRARDDR